MEDYLKKMAGSREEIIVKCPKCSSTEVIIMENKEGYYEVFECKKCSYKNNIEML